MRYKLGAFLLIAGIVFTFFDGIYYLMIKKEYNILAENLKFPEGRIYMKDGSIILVEIARGTLSKVIKDGKVEVVAHLGGGPNGLPFIFFVLFHSYFGCI